MRRVGGVPRQGDEHGGPGDGNKNGNTKGEEWRWGKVGTNAERKTKTNMRQAVRFSLFNEVRQEELFLVPARRGDLRSLI